MPDKNPGLLETLLTEAAGVLGATVEALYDTGSEFSEKFKKYIDEKVEKGFLTVDEARRLYEQYQRTGSPSEISPKPYIPPNLGNGKTADQIRDQMKNIEDLGRRLNGGS
jgi:polyhydroxyalkanoate synthesis regulator phasin